MKKETSIIEEGTIEIKGPLSQHEIVRKVINSFIDDKKQENPQKFDALLNALTAICNCSENDVDQLLKNYPDLQVSFQTGARVDVLLKVINWMFIMEDIVYWNYQGRSMLYNALKEV